MTKQELLDVYRDAWDAYYTLEHVERVIRRSRSWGLITNKVKWMMLTFFCAASIENVHPMDSGLFRRKFRRDRRKGMPIENVVLFYGRYIKEIIFKHVKYFMTYLVYHQIYRRVMKESVPIVENDVAMNPVDIDELEHLELFTIHPAPQLDRDKAKLKAKLIRTEERTGKISALLGRTEVGVGLETAESSFSHKDT